MVRDNLDDIPQYDLPDGFSIRNFGGGDGPNWASIGAAAGNFQTLEDAEDRFTKEFLDPVGDMESRCFFVVENAGDRAIGTAMAWYDADFDDGSGRSGSRPTWGRVHWVSIIPEFQGKGLAKPMMTAVLNRLAESHDRAVLGTQTFRKTAVRLYLDLGFRPFFSSPTCPQAWKDLAEELRHPALTEYA